ncbi:SulP family inorganic anion transporter [Cellulomonas humilata]|uniref:SulP family inorganic anion transporter n=1 Tax=Cellulomonas humilata TaxID=144055 RepID=UPI0031B579A9
MDRGRVVGLLPGVGVARSYERAWLRPDLVAGATLVAVAIPAGMAYATAAGLPPVTGLYATIVPFPSMRSSVRRGCSCSARTHRSRR